MDLAAAVETVAAIQTREFPPHVAALTPQQRLDWLNSAEACQLLSKSARKRLRKPLLALTRTSGDPGKAQEEAEKQINVIRNWAQSDSWRGELVAHLDREGLRSMKRAVIIAACLESGLHPLYTHVIRRRPAGVTVSVRVCLHRVCVECGHVAPAGEVSSAGWCSDCRTEWVALRKERLATL